MKGHVTSIEIGSPYGGKRQNVARVHVRHGAPKKQKNGLPTVGDDAPTSVVHMSEERAKRFSRGQKVNVSLEPDADDLPKFKTKAERDRYLETFHSEDEA